MPRISYLNGQFLPHENCLVHIEDRGFQFGDGAYEVTLFDNKKLVDGDAHIERFFRSLRELKIEHNFTADQLTKIQIELFARNEISSGSCYIQITRGATNRTPWFPKGIAPTISATVSPRKGVSEEEFARGFSLVTFEDIRWQRCDIKSVALLGSTFLNQKSKDEGFDDAILVRNGFVTEATFANVFIVDANDTLITRPADNLILKGTVRNRMIALAKEKGIKVEEKLFTVEEMLKAKEVFLTSSNLIIRPVGRINNQAINDGANRRVAKILSDSYQDFIAA